MKDLATAVSSGDALEPKQTTLVCVRPAADREQIAQRCTADSKLWLACSKTTRRAPRNPVHTSKREDYERALLHNMPSGHATAATISKWKYCGGAAMSSAASRGRWFVWVRAP